jgi:hypothetical protein
MNQTIQGLGNEASVGQPPQVQHYQCFEDAQSSNDDLLEEATANYF